MEKYKLKKDTFFFEAGTICLLTPKGNLILEDSAGTVVLRKHQLESHPELIDEWFEKIEEKEYGGRVPKNGDEYWVVYADGAIMSERWKDIELDRDLFKCGSAFWSEEEAEKEVKRRKAYVVLKEDTKGFEPDWKDTNTHKFLVLYNHESKALLVNGWFSSQTQQGLYFKAKEDAEASIEAHRQSWLDYLGIEEEVKDEN